MIMITGGAAQGKTAFAKEHCPDVRFIDGADCGEEELFSCGGIRQFHQYIRRFSERIAKDPEGFAKELYEADPGIVVVTTEIGCGLVPIEQEDRDYRDAVGKTCTALASLSEEVWLVTCGIPKRIK